MLISLYVVAALAWGSVLQPVPEHAPVVAQAAEPDFHLLTIPDEGNPPIEGAVWLPTQADSPLPLIVISHGTGGFFLGHEATARALADAGFAVAALTHTGDNWRDRSRSTDASERPRQLVVLIDFMLEQWEGRAQLDAERVGAFGFSYGGFTVLAAAGGRPDMSRMADHCRANPDFYDCRMLIEQGAARDETEWHMDSRIRAVASAAPALGFTFDREGLSGVVQPVQLWRGEHDEVLPTPHYVEPVRDGLPRPPEYHVVEGAGHFDFMPPCPPYLESGAPEICGSPPGFDRAAFQTRFNAELIRFFRHALK